MTTYKLTEYYVELYFDKIPSENIRDTLKIYNFHYIKNKRCWSAKKTDDCISVAKNICILLNPQEPNVLDILPQKEIAANDLIIRSNSFYCNKHHKNEDMTGLFTIIGSNGKGRIIKAPISYCKTCDEYYILDETYRDLKKRGSIFCQIMTITDYLSTGKFDNDFSKWKDKSPLKIWGYSISQNDDLSEEQRHAILINLIHQGIMSKDCILSYLAFFIKLHQGNDYTILWQEDYNYLSHFDEDKYSFVIVKYKVSFS